MRSLTLLLAVFALAVMMLLTSCSTTTYVCPDGSTSPTKEGCFTVPAQKSALPSPSVSSSVENMALSLSDLPQGFEVDSQEAGLEDESEVSEGDMAMGWKEGYYCAFVNPTTGEHVFCRVARYGALNLSALFSGGLPEGAAAIEGAEVGDASRAFRIIDRSLNITHVSVEFSRDDVLVGVIVERQGVAAEDIDLEAFHLAEDIDGRVRNAP